MLRALVCCAFVIVAACTAPGPRLASLPPAELLSGAALGIPGSASAPLPRAAVFELDAAMRDFVTAHVGTIDDHPTKLRRLLNGMKDRGFFSLEYDETLTRTARETFYQLEGNCLSFTVLFVGLARAAGLNVSYQIVDMPPTWSREADLVIATNHINALVETRSGQFVVDFNLAGYQSERKRRVVDDDHVLALFYNNLGAEALIRADYPASFRYLRGAIEADADVSHAWVNLGVLYRRLGHLTLAEAAYGEALKASPGDGSALSNLASLAARLGNEAAAADYRQMIRHYQRRNPYYHYFRAREAFAESRFEEAGDAVRHALRLKNDEPAFRELRALVTKELAALERGAANGRVADAAGASAADRASIAEPGGDAAPSAAPVAQDFRVQ